MRRLLQLSDLHFGRHDPAVVEALVAAVVDEKPDLVVISGDFTQRARRREFEAAAAFLARLHGHGLKTLGVPGNHDIPLYDVVRRFLNPLARYKRYIDATLCPFVADDEIAVLGINTARSLTFKDGRVNAAQMTMLRRRFAEASAGAARILVTHHPLVALPGGAGGQALAAAGRSPAALAAALSAGVEIVLAGHHHRPFSGAGVGFVAEGDRLLVIQAGTSTSTRTRDYANSFNRIDLDGSTLTILVRSWDGVGFSLDEGERYGRTDGRWRRIERAPL